MVYQLGLLEHHNYVSYVQLLIVFVDHMSWLVQMNHSYCLIRMMTRNHSSMNRSLMHHSYHRKLEQQLLASHKRLYVRSKQG